MISPNDPAFINRDMSIEAVHSRLWRTLAALDVIQGDNNPAGWDNPLAKTLFRMAQDNDDELNALCTRGFQSSDDRTNGNQ